MKSIEIYFYLILNHTFFEKNMADGNSTLRILAQPHPSHRERYSSELDPTRNRPQRFIRADKNDYNLDHPTLEVK